MEWGLSHAMIVKLSDDELAFFTGIEDLDKAAEQIRLLFPQIRMLTVTAGSRGSYAYYEDKKVFVPAFSLGGTIDTTGAGDTFWGCILNDVLEYGIEGRTPNELEQICIRNS